MSVVVYVLAAIGALNVLGMLAFAFMIWRQERNA